MEDKRVGTLSLSIGQSDVQFGAIGDINKVMILKPEGLYVIKKKKLKSKTPSPPLHTHPERSHSKMGAKKVESWLHVHNHLTLDVLGPERNGPQP